MNAANVDETSTPLRAQADCIAVVTFRIEAITVQRHTKQNDTPFITTNAN